MIEHSLTEKQLRFAEEYIKEPNATKAYMAAYPSVKKESTANAAGSRLLANVKVSSYIDERMKQLQSERIADATEVLETLTSVLRGQKKGTALVGAGMGEQDVMQVEPTVAEKIRAAELLGKRYKLFTEKAEVEVAGAVQFIDDISESDEE
ncbi:terminase small subunit [Kurthia senegalensis]|uniref:terminase small subunit n=1 Tax=Kurthia senegalensis TaxID=1033740 RepID=UPI00028A0A8A|nr:terminase small subunit [Kurthia senegalensis]